MHCSAKLQNNYAHNTSCAAHARRQWARGGGGQEAPDLEHFHGRGERLAIRVLILLPKGVRAIPELHSAQDRERADTPHVGIEAIT